MFKMKKNEQNENILYLSGILNYHIMFTIFKFREKESQKSGVPYQNQVGAKKAVYPTKQKWERKKKVVNSILG